MMTNWPGAAHVVIYSGGMDSYTLLRMTQISHGYEEYDPRFLALSFDYGQRHRRELDFARRVCARHHIAHKVIPLGSMLLSLGGSALTETCIPVPEGHYAAESMKLTVVPGRNTVMLAIGMAHAEAMANALHVSVAQPNPVLLLFGAHAGDHHIYPDCRPGYVDLLTKTMCTATEFKMRLTAPFLYYSKAGILKVGLDAGIVPADYLDTYTCYNGGKLPCGKCGSCNERAEAFQENGVIDPWTVPGALAEEVNRSLAIDPRPLAG